jgi:putative peptidoglycan lipid II flippase
VATHKGDALILAAGSVAWAVAAVVILVVTGSKLPGQILRRKS